MRDVLPVIPTSTKFRVAHFFSRPPGLVGYNPCNMEYYGNITLIPGESFSQHSLWRILHGSFSPDFRPFPRGIYKELKNTTQYTLRELGRFSTFPPFLVEKCSRFQALMAFSPRAVRRIAFFHPFLSLVSTTVTKPKPTSSCLISFPFRAEIFRDS